LTWAVPPALLEERLPPGCVLDTHDGRAFVSLVAFEFLQTRVFGVRWPGHTNFAELNLRFYVRRDGERGVVFIREFVPKRLIAWMAWWLYNEPYHAAPVTAHRHDAAGTFSMEYRLRYADRFHTIRATGTKPAVRPGPESDEHFFKEHQWGFGTTRDGVALRYQVQHPEWDVWPVSSHSLDFDFSAVYGPEWGFLGSQPPMSAVLAAGSPVSVFPKGRA
ncbi:MAG: DUF2071 domain-containing protein, partial [Gemmataceae bacterium]|nr:DUF2071 domain-containing protein [Gemmataceae bacterium]